MDMFDSSEIDLSVFAVDLLRNSDWVSTIMVDICLG